MNRVYAGLLVMLFLAVGVGLGWYTTQGGDSADTSTAQIAPGEPESTQSEPAPQSDAPSRPERPRTAFPGDGYELAQVREGRQVEILDEPGGKVIEKIGDESEMFGSPRVFPVLKPGPRWLGVTAAELDGKIGWIRYDPQVLALGDTRISLRVDLTENTLMLMRDDEVLREATVTIGREGTETPTGRFSITDTLTENLNPVYGAGAVVTSARQHSLAAGWSGGNMIAIHGWQGPVGGAASGGCLRMANEDVLALIDSVPLGAPIFISA